VGYERFDDRTLEYGLHESPPLCESH
jgi:hypothetical protein